ncbi:HMCN [Mytilus coruscus]|uniref:HMCN n=1 Tax=Mytilus coruscus TaxID=42192 RepID=A0A6J8EBV5_MYTCO|nr:HMCN [Mytilus coruscus]
MYSAIGSTVNLTCNLNVERMYLTWVGPPNLSAYATRNEVEQTKQSIIKIIGNEREKQHILQIKEMKETNEDFTVEPTVKIVPDRTVNITENEPLQLQCNYTSNDDNNTSIIWKYISYGRTKYIQANNSLNVEHIGRTDAGEYTCVVSNSTGKAIDTVTVYVLYLPEINITFESINSNKILRCNAYGNPADYVFFAWEHRTEYGDHIRYLNDNGNGFITLHHSPGKTDINHEQGIYNGVPYDGKMYRLANYILKQNGMQEFKFT